jgi:hypothetical protein
MLQPIRDLYFNLVNGSSRLKMWPGSKIAFSINWNFRHTLILFLTVFGFYGWGTSSGSWQVFDLANLLTSMSIIFSAFLLYARRVDFNSYFKKQIQIDFNAVASALFFVFIGVMINFKYLFNSLTGDETAYAWFSQLHAYVVTLRIAPYLPNQLLEVNSAVTLQLVAIIILLVGIISIVAFYQIQSDLRFLVTLLFVTFLLREGVRYAGGANGPNSPLSSLWYFLSSSLFGLKNSTYRFSTLIIFCCLSAYLYRRIKGQTLTSRIIALLSSLLVFSIPLVSSMSFILEISNWTFVTSVVLFVELAKKKFLFDEKMVIFLSITYYFRVNAITLIIPALFCMAVTDGAGLIKHKWKYIYPLCIILPGLIPVIIGRLAGRLSGEGDLFADFSMNYQNTLSAVSLSGSTWYSVVVATSILVLLFSSSARKYIISLILLDIVVFLVLNTPQLTVSSKYIIEFFFPLVFVLALWPMILNSNNHKYITSVVLIALVAVNIYGLSSKQEISKVYSKVYNSPTGGIGESYAVLPFTPLAYDKAFQFIGQRGLQPCFNAGIVYSAFPEILAGLPLSQIVINRQIRNDVLEAQVQIGESWTTISHESLHASNIDCVILGTVENQSTVVRELMQKNWRVLGKFPDKNYETLVYVMTKEAG